MNKDKRRTSIHDITSVQNSNSGGGGNPGNPGEASGTVIGPGGGTAVPGQPAVPGHPPRNIYGPGMVHPSMIPMGPPPAQPMGLGYARPHMGRPVMGSPSFPVPGYVPQPMHH